MPLSTSTRNTVVCVRSSSSSCTKALAIMAYRRCEYMFYYTTQIALARCPSNHCTICKTVILSMDFFLLYSVLYPPCTKSTTKVQRSMADCDRLTHAMCVSKYTMQLPASPRSMQSAYVIASVYIFGVYASHALSRGSGKHTKTHGSRSTIAQNFAFRNSVSVFCSSHRGKNRARIALLATATISSQCR